MYSDPEAYGKTFRKAYFFVVFRYYKTDLNGIFLLHKSMINRPGAAGAIL